MWHYREYIGPDARTRRPFRNGHPCNGIKTRFSLEELDNEAPGMLHHGHGSINSAVVPTTGEEVHRSGSVDAALGTYYATIFRIGRRVDDDSVQRCTFLDVIQRDAISRRP